MAKDFFVDLTNVDGEPAREHTEEKTIRNVTVRRKAPAARGAEPRPPRRKNYVPLWSLAAVLIVALGFFGISFFASSSVIVTPRVHQITFDPSSVFVALSEGSGLTYSTEKLSFEEYMAVPAEGVEKVEDRATGEVTIYNEYATTPVRLIKNTRFESPTGAIYRIPTSVVVPGKSGTTAGQIKVTVIADSAGPAFNTGPIDKLTVPGLKNTAAMYSGVYARAPQGMSGGFVGDRPAVASGALESARTQLRTKLTEKVRSELSQERSDTFVLPDLARLTFENLPTTADGGNGKVGVKVAVEVPVFNRSVFAASIAQAVSAEASSGDIRFRPASNFAARVATSTVPNSVAFGLDGSATLVWSVNTDELRAALLGKDQDAFEAIVSQFPGVQKADAQVAPFWKSSFPNNPDKLKISVSEPSTP